MERPFIGGYNLQNTILFNEKALSINVKSIHLQIYSSYQMFTVFNIKFNKYDF